jgi:hypothetical protein
VWQGRLIGIAGNSGAGAHGRVHLHLELRNGNGTQNTCVDQTHCFGNPVTWDGMDIDGWRIFEYYADGEGTSAFNYDGSAVKDGSVQGIPNFAYWDTDDAGNPTINRCSLAACQQQPPVIARVGTAFDQSPNRCAYATATDCENNTVDPNTQFAKSGDPGSLSGGTAPAGSIWPPLSAGHLTSTNVLVSGGVGGIAELSQVDSPPLESARSSLAAGPIAGIVAGVMSFGTALSAAAWYARRRWPRRVSG